MPKLWNVFRKMRTLLEIKQLSQAGMERIIRRVLMQLKGKPSKKALAVSPQIRERLTSLLKQVRGSQLANSVGRIIYQYQPRLALVKVGRQYKLAKKLAVTGAALLLFLSAGTQAEAQQEVNAGGFRVQFWSATDGDHQYGTETISSTDLGNWTDPAEREAVIRAFEYWSKRLGLGSTPAANAPVIRVVIDTSFNDAQAASTLSTSATPSQGNASLGKTNTMARLAEGKTPGRVGGLDGRIRLSPAVLSRGTERITQLMTNDNGIETTVIHEIGHLLGITASGGSGSQSADATTRNQVFSSLLNSDDNFVGPQALATYGAPVEFQTGDTHPFLDYHNITRANPFGKNFRNIAPASPVELSMISDLGFTSLNLGRQFGTAIYQDGTGASEVISSNFISSQDYAVGLFLQGQNRNINITGDMDISGFAGTGIRIAGRDNDNLPTLQEENIITIGPDSLILMSGDHGIGVLASSGSNNVIVHRGSIRTTGENSAGIVLDFGYFVNDSRQITSRDYEDFLVSRLDITGEISTGSNRAIYVADNAAIGEINLMQGAWISGDIFIDSVFEPEQNQAGKTVSFNRPVISFGRLANTDGSASNDADANFHFVYEDNIGGETLMDAEFIGGRADSVGTAFTGKVAFQNATVGQQGQLTNLGDIFIVNDFENHGVTTITMHPFPSLQGEMMVGGDVINHAGAELINLSVKGLIVEGELENRENGVVENTGRIIVQSETFNNGVLFNNLNGQLFAMDSVFNQDQGNLTNMGLLLTSEDVRNSGEAYNFGTLISGTMLVNEVDGHFVNNGQAAVGTNFVNRGNTVNGGVLKSVEAMSNAFEAVLTNNAQVEAGTSFTNTGTLNNNGNLFANTAFNNLPDGVVMNNGNVTVTNGDVNLSFESQFVNNGGQLNAQAGNIDIRGELTSRHGFVNASGVITVFDEGRFQGTPLVTATLVDNQTGGTMAAGNSIGTMTIDADYQTSGTVEYEITAQNVPQDSDLIHVINNHSATINNNTPSYAQRGTFEFTAEAGSYDIARRYTILATQNDGDLVVVQRPITTDNLVDQRLILRTDKDLDSLYTADARLYYGYIGRDVPFAQLGQTPNEVAVGEVLDAIKLIDDGTALGDDIQWIRDTLDLIVDEADVRSAMNQVSGSFFGSVSPMAIQLMHANQARMFASMRGDNTVCAYDDETTGPMGLYGAVTGFGTGGHVGTDGNAQGYRFGGGGTQAIVGYGSGEAQVGGYYTYTGGSLRGAGRSGLEMHEFGGFFHHKSDSNYFLMSAGGGYAGFDVSRTIRFGNTDIQNPIVQQYQNDLSVGLANINAEIGKELLFDSMLLRPFIGLGYAYVGGDNFAENGGSLALTGQMNSLNSFRSTLGSDVSFCLGGDTTLDLRAAWMHEFERDRAGTVVSNFSNGAGGSFVVRGVDMGSDFALLGANISREFAEGSVRVFGGYDLIFDGQQALNTGSGGVEFLW